MKIISLRSSRTLFKAVRNESTLPPKVVIASHGSCTGMTKELSYHSNGVKLQAIIGGCLIWSNPFQLIHRDVIEKVLMIFLLQLLFPSHSHALHQYSSRREKDVQQRAAKRELRLIVKFMLTNLPEERIAHKLSWKCLLSPFRLGNAPWSRDTCAWFPAHWTSLSCRSGLMSQADSVVVLPAPQARNLQKREKQKIN